MTGRPMTGLDLAEDSVWPVPGRFIRSIPWVTPLDELWTDRYSYSYNACPVLYVKPDDEHVYLLVEVQKTALTLKCGN